MKLLKVWFCCVYFVQGLLSITSIDKLINLQNGISDLVPLYPSDNLNYYYTFLFIGDPQQKLIVAISIFGLESIFICQNDSNHKNVKGIYNPFLSLSSYLSSIDYNKSNKLSLLYFLKLSDDQFFEFSSIYEESHIYFGTYQNGLFTNKAKMLINCLDVNSSINLADSENNMISGIINLNYNNSQKIQNDNIFEEKFIWGYAFYFNETKGLLKLLKSPFNFNNLNQQFNYLLMSSIQKKETDDIPGFPISTIILENKNLMSINESFFVTFSTLTNFIQFSGQLYDDFMKEFQEFCSLNEGKCIGKKFVNSNQCFFKEIINENDFFHSFPYITIVMNETSNFSLTSKDYFFELSKNYFCIAIERNDRLDNTLIFGNYFLINKSILIDAQSSIFYLLTPKSKINNFDNIFQTDIVPVTRKQIQAINSLAIILPIVFSILFIICIIVYFIKRKNLRLKKLKELEKKSALSQSHNEVENSFEISYDTYENQKKKKELLTELASLHDHKESIDKLLGENENKKNLNIKTLDTVTIALTDHVLLESPLSEMLYK